ncbi:MAG: hypothetical protein Q8L04_02135, partial [Ignavibacteria bacterium]|nr:hypothetical protein [Ignavibacteria bacterium]
MANNIYEEFAAELQDVPCFTKQPWNYFSPSFRQKLNLLRPKTNTKPTPSNAEVKKLIDAVVKGNTTNFNLLKEFLEATNDENRIRFSSKLSDNILDQNFFSDAEYLRTELLKREISQNIYYDKHRDHICHTLNNYLLGWYFFLYCTKIREEFAKAFLARELLPTVICNKYKTEVGYQYDTLIRDLNDEEIEIALNEIFSDLWPYASLLHDIGYLFEGSIKSNSGELDSEQIELGADVINNFYSSVFWKLSNISSTDVKQLIIEDVFEGEKNFNKIFINKESIFTIADSLRSINFFNKLYPINPANKKIREKFTTCL